MPIVDFKYPQICGEGSPCTCYVTQIKLTIKPTTISNSGNEVVQKLQQEMEQLRRLLQEK